MLANALSLLETLVRETAWPTFISQIQIAAPRGDCRVLPFKGAGRRTIGYEMRGGWRIAPWASS